MLIVTDGTDFTRNAADLIAAAFIKKEGFRVLIRGASQDFSGADMLPADMYFFGAAEPHPVSFDYLEELLRHINLVGRPCGVFSSGSREALDYLSEMVRDSELALYPEPLLAGPSAKPAEITAWVAKVVKGCP